MNRLWLIVAQGAADAFRPGTSPLFDAGQLLTFSVAGKDTVPMLTATVIAPASPSLTAPNLAALAIDASQPLDVALKGGRCRRSGDPHWHSGPNDR